MPTKLICKLKFTTYVRLLLRMDDLRLGILT